MEIFTDEYFMKMALAEAEDALMEGEVPIGAVVVAGDRVIARGHNHTQLLNDVTAHAEMEVITAATNRLGAKYLNDCIIIHVEKLRLALSVVEVMTQFAFGLKML